MYANLPPTFVVIEQYKINNIICERVLGCESLKYSPDEYCKMRMIRWTCSHIRLEIMNNGKMGMGGVGQMVEKECLGEGKDRFGSWGLFSGFLLLGWRIMFVWGWIM